MSEYQYYEFRTMDRRLSETEMHELRLHTTRARITPTSFINEYDWGNFKGDPDAWMEKYFDGHLYFANWGTRVLQLALPAKVLPEETANCYCGTDVASARRVSERLILRFVSEEDSGYDDDLLEGDGLLSSLLPLGSDIVGGDLRCLYLGWLLSMQHHQVDDDAVEPPVPPDLGKLSGTLSDFADFLRIDRDLLAVAAEASPRVASLPPSRKEMVVWMASVPAKEKDRVLVDLISGEDPLAAASLSARFNRDCKAADNRVVQQRRKAAELRAVVEKRRSKAR